MTITSHAGCLLAAGFFFVVHVGAHGAEQNRKPEDKDKRIEIKLPHKDDVYGEGPEWDKQYAREALQILKDLKPDPAWEAKLAALPDNTWLSCNPAGDQQPENGRSETPAVYVPSIDGLFFTCGCTHPGYSSDCWVYHCGSNRWVQMWPNYSFGGEGSALNKEAVPTDRPARRCSLGLAMDTDRDLVVLRGGANGADLRTWTWNPKTNEWKIEAERNTGYQREGAEDNCLGFAAGFGAIEIGGKAEPQATTWIFRDGKWNAPATKGAPPGGRCSRLVWASGPKQEIFLAYAGVWAFDPKALTWENITPPKGGAAPPWIYRQGIAYDSVNNVVILYGVYQQTEHLGPWIYSFATKTWTEMNSTNPPPVGYSQQMMMDYDSKHNVVVIACNNRGTWVYRYKKAAKGK